MPGLDKRGPEGRGSMTGRKTGLCVGNTIGENRDVGPIRRGRGAGRMQRGWLRGETDQGRSSHTVDKERLAREITEAKAHLEFLADQLKKIEQKDK